MVKEGEPHPMTAGVHCPVCDFNWEDDDPALKVECPKCHAKAGVRCGEQHPSGHKIVFGIDVHDERDLLALHMGFYEHEGCDGPKVNPEHKAIIKFNKEYPQYAIPL